jgi:hypothetical protein
VPGLRPKLAERIAMSQHLGIGERMTAELLEQVVAAHGGAAQWDKFRQAIGHVRISGDLWAALGGSPGYADARFELLTHEQSVTAYPVSQPGMRYRFKPNVLVIESDDGEVIETQYNARATFPKSSGDERWDDFQVAYICSYSVWNCVTQPFLFTYPGFEVQASHAIDVNGEPQPRLSIHLPSNVVSHARVIDMNVRSDGLMSSQDFVFGVMNAQVTSVFSDYCEIQGLTLPMVRRMYRSEAWKTNREEAPVLACLELLELEFQ